MKSSHTMIQRVQALAKGTGTATEMVKGRVMDSGWAQQLQEAGQEQEQGEFRRQKAESRMQKTKHASNEGRGILYTPRGLHSLWQPHL